MKNIRLLWNNLFDDAVLTVSSEDTDFPKTNLSHRWHTRHWRSTGVASEWIKVNLGSAMDVQAVVLKYHNFTSGATIKIQGNATDSWASPTVDETLVYHAGLMYYFWDAAQNYQWWRWSLVDAGNGDGYLRVGRPYIGGYFSPTHNYAYTSRKRLIDPSRKMYSSGGQISTSLKSHYRAWSYNFGSILSVDADTFETIFDDVGQSKPYFLCEDADDAYNTFYYVQNSEDWELVPIDKIQAYYSLTVGVEEMR